MQSDGQTALGLACSNGNIAVIDVLLEANANVELGSGEHKVTPLCIAADDVKMFLDADTLRDAQKIQDAQARQILVARRLVAVRASVEHSSGRDDFTPLAIAAQFSTFEMVKYLVEQAKADLEHGSGRDIGLTPLAFAVKAGRAEIVRFVCHCSGC